MQANKIAAATKRKFAMGYDQKQQTSSSGVAVVIVLAAVTVAVLGIVVVVGARMYFLSTSSSRQMRTVAVNQVNQAVVQDLRTRGEAMHVIRQGYAAEDAPSILRSNVAAKTDPQLSFDVRLDREGIVRVDGEEVGLDGLKTRLATFKEETNNAIAMRIHVDRECSYEFLIPVLDLCREVGGIEVRVAMPK